MTIFKTLALTSALMIGAASPALAQTSSPGGSTAGGTTSSGTTGAGGTTSAGTATGSGPTGSAMTPGMTSPSTRSDTSDTRVGTPDAGTGTTDGSAYGSNPIPGSDMTRNSGSGNYLPAPGAGDRIDVPTTSLGGAATGTDNPPDVAPANPNATDGTTTRETSRENCPVDAAGVPNCTAQ